MALKVSKISELKEYIGQVIVRSEEHAEDAKEILLPLLGAIVWKSTDIIVRTYNGKKENELWIYIGGKRYAFSYSHSEKKISIKKETIKGSVLHSFDNNTSVKEIFDFFSKL